MAKKRRVNVRKHKRKLKSGNATIVRKHNRQLKTATKIRKHNDPDKVILPDAEWYRQNTGEDFYDYLYKDNYPGGRDTGYAVASTYLEQCFPLKNDPHLPDGALCSIVKLPTDGEGDTINNLVLKRYGTDKEGYISCVHTAVTDISLEDLPKDLTELYGLSQGEQMKLSPIEHFRALRSWAEGITEYGIENAILDSLADLDMPFGFNWELQRQFLNAIHDTYGDVGVLLAIDVLNNIYNNLDGDYDWSNQRYNLLHHYLIGCGADAEMFDKCHQLFPGWTKEINKILATGENTSPEVFEKLYQKKYNVDLSYNPSTPPFILKKIYQNIHNNLLVTNNLAANPSTSPSILRELSKHNEGIIRAKVAQNPNTPPDVLVQLSNDDLSRIQLGLIYNKNLPIDIIYRLYNRSISSRGDLITRRVLAWNPNTPPSLLKKLRHDESSYVREAAWARTEELNLKK